MPVHGGQGSGVPQSPQWRSQNWTQVKAPGWGMGAKGSQASLGGLRSWGAQQRSHWEGPRLSPF